MSNILDTSDSKCFRRFGAVASRRFRRASPVGDCRSICAVHAALVPEGLAVLGEVGSVVGSVDSDQRTASCESLISGRPTEWLCSREIGPVSRFSLEPPSWRKIGKILPCHHSFIYCFICAYLYVDARLRSMILIKIIISIHYNLYLL